MWSCSTGDMLSQNSRAWLKWSSNDAGSSRTLAPGHGLRHVEERAVGVAGDEGAAAVERVRPVRRDPAVHGVLVMPSRSMSLTGACGRLIGSWLKFGPAEPGQLGVDVGEQARLQQRVVGDVDAGHEVADVEGHLLGLGEEVRRVAREGQQAERLHRGQLLRHQLGRVEQVDALEGLVGAVLEDLDAELPLGVGAGLDRVVRGRAGGSRGPCRRASAPPPRSSECTPSRGFQWNLTSVVPPSALTSRKVCTPKPSMSGTSAGCRGRTCSRSCGAAPRGAARRSPRRCRAPTAPAGSRGRGAASPRGRGRGT